MAFEDKYRLSVHAVITDNENRILQLKATYNDKSWGLPGGALEPGETIHEALQRECREELGTEVTIRYMSGMYYHSFHNSHACIFKCDLHDWKAVKLSREHSEFRYFTIEELSKVQRQRVSECLDFDGFVKSDKF